MLLPSDWEEEELEAQFRRPLSVVLDTVPYIDKAGHGVLHFAGADERAVVVTTLDVYRAFAIAWAAKGEAAWLSRCL
jgi:hypothetical protein